MITATKLHAKSLAVLALGLACTGCNPVFAAMHSQVDACFAALGSGIRLTELLAEAQEKHVQIAPETIVGLAEKQSKAIVQGTGLEGREGVLQGYILHTPKLWKECLHKLFDDSNGVILVWRKAMGLFGEPEQIIRLGSLCGSTITPDEAQQRIDGWKQNAVSQGERHLNNDRVVLSLFDHTGNWARPWHEAGYSVYCLDLQDNPEVSDANLYSVEHFIEWFGDFREGDVYAILAACPCTEFASSGARHFAAKDDDGRTDAAIELVMQTVRTVEYYHPAVWAIENPVGRIGNCCNLPHWRLAFDPCHVGSPYTKRTQLWGRFNPHLPVAPVDPSEGSKMHRLYGGKSERTKNARSETPEGFAYSFFAANNAIDNQALALSCKYDRLDYGLFEQLVSTGIGAETISHRIDDYYFLDLDDEAAEQSLIELLPEWASERFS